MFQFKRRLIVLAAGLCLPSALFGAPISLWDGGSATTNNWTDSINWSTNVVPANDGSVQIFLAGSTRLSPNVDTPFNISGLAYDFTAGSFILGGSTLTIQGLGITNGDDSPQQVANPITLGVPQTWSSGVNFSRRQLYPAGFALRSQARSRFRMSAVVSTVIGLGGFQ